jgi:hypothetical protein
MMLGEALCSPFLFVKIQFELLNNDKWKADARAIAAGSF